MTHGTCPKRTPADLFGPLLSAVQERNILADGKTFVDAVPRRPVAEIMDDFDKLGGDDGSLAKFVADNFDVPAPIAPAKAAPATRPLREHIRAMWPSLARGPQAAAPNSSALPIRQRYVVPGGRFREVYYWDSFFTMLGLVRDGELALANGIVDAMTDMIEEYGYVPNGARTYFLGRSQPPVYHMMVGLLDEQTPSVKARRLSAMKREHSWWMRGSGDLAPGQTSERVVRLTDGGILNRYWDPQATPREESWREDVETARASDRPAPDVYRDLRAGAESGWDFSSRWFGSDDLHSIRTTSIVPVDLNAFLYGLEMAIAKASDQDANEFATRAAMRKATTTAHLWSADLGSFCDFDLLEHKLRSGPTAAALTPLMTGMATQAQADASAKLVSTKLLAPGGLRTTVVASGEQWDKPNGWAPLQWIGVTALNRYGHGNLAGELARRWVGMIEAVYAKTGLIFEKYDIEACSIGSGGEYAAQVGFGWTNGVTADFMDMLACDDA